MRTMVKGSRVSSTLMVLVLSLESRQAIIGGTIIIRKGRMIVIFVYFLFLKGTS